MGKSQFTCAPNAASLLVRLWKFLKQKLSLLFTQRPADLGDMMFSLSYLPTAERLTVVVVKARGLKWSKGRTTGGK